MKLHLNLKARAVVLHVVAAGLILGFASLGTNWFFSRMVLGQFDQSLLELFKTEASAILADPAQSLHVHEMPARSGPPSFPRLDKFVQIIELDGHVVGRSANLGSARLPASPAVLARLRNGEEVLETLRDFGDEPVRVLSAPIVVRGQTYAIQIAGSLDDARAALRSARWLFFFSSAAILVAIGLAGAFLAWAILRPIDRIVRRARGIGALALAERLPHPGGHDEIARLVETLNEMLGRIEQAFEGQRRFTADASHELRSPLSRLRAELEVTLRRPRQRVEYEDTLRSCLDEVERLSRLTEELLTLAHLDAGEAQELPASPVPLAPILAEVVTRMEPDAHERGVEIVVDAPAGLTVNVAPGTAALVVANVLDNAVKYSPRGGRVRVDAVADNGAAVVAISDAGPGVTEEEIPHLFERFYRGSAARRSDVPGTGLGLAICRIVAEAQGGGVTVSSGPNGGAVFRVRLPLAARRELPRPEPRMRRALRLWPLLTGTIRYEKVVSTRHRGHGEYIDAPILAYLIETPNGRILYDAGCDYRKVATPELRARYFDPMRPRLEPPSMTEAQRVSSYLARLGLGPHDIDVVVLGHLHFDHAGGLGELPGRDVHVHQAELAAFATGLYHGVFADELAGKDAWRLQSGDYGVAPGVRALCTPGHTAGHMSLFVELAKGRPVILCGDAADLMENLTEEIAPGYCWQEDDALALQSIRKLKAIGRETGAELWPNHDLAFFRSLPPFPASRE